ncbi:alpha/beta hydrolase family protein [Staphylococcus agnetis]|uniref:alpha/beta hydrolase family protein n=1 Tax=Staphylococcus agnetis TaxID=985762 RepID=UPI0021D225C2|nr:alpha/beta hydrolase [Staphylococcus agnetis]UXU59133.1 alpha/beta hydrolase [Staphylococcus agnetis]UXU61459.1 alpha/beta hydrolase [Staphylococcus agnetis]
MESYMYGTHQAQHYDVYLNESAENTTWLALVHGGYWREKFDKHMLNPLIDAFIDAGFSIINIEYRRGPKHQWPIPANDVHEALNHFKHTSYAPKRIVGIGHSVGGQLVLLNHRDLDALVGLAPVSDVLYTLHHHLGQDAVAEYFETRATKLLRQASPITQLPISCDALIVHGFNDNAVHIDTSISFIHENYQKGHYITFYALPYLDHLDCINPEGTHFKLLLSWLKQFA